VVLKAFEPLLVSHLTQEMFPGWRQQF